MDRKIRQRCQKFCFIPIWPLEHNQLTIIAVYLKSADHPDFFTYINELALFMLITITSKNTLRAQSSYFWSNSGVSPKRSILL
jgi:hypothetical protein